MSARTGEIEARLLVPYRPHLFGKQRPVVLELSRMALLKDEVFLILAMIYSEAKRQEKMVSTSALLSPQLGANRLDRIILRVLLND
jgi:hypothetical protein